MAIKTNIELLAENDAAYTANPILPATVKSFNDDVIDSKEHFFESYTTAQRDLISAPTLRQMIFNTDVIGYQYWDGSVWRDLSGGNGVNGGTPAMFSYRFTGIADQSLYTVPVAVLMNIDAVRRQGVFTELYTPDSSIDTDNFLLAGGAVEDGEVIQIFYHQGGAVSVSGLNVTPQTTTARNADKVKNYAAALNTLSTEVIDLTATGTYNYALPSGLKFFATNVFVELVDTYIVTGQPTIQLGTIANATMLGGFGSIGTADGDCRSNSISGAIKGATDLQVKITGAATAGVMKARFVFVGSIIQDEA